MGKMPIYFVTGNEEKLKEMRLVIPSLSNLKIDLREIQNLDAKKVIEEKIKEAWERYPELEILVEDTSLYFDCLNGMPGPYIKDFLKTLGNDGLYNLVSKYGNYGATAKTIIGHGRKGYPFEFFEGAIRGKIVSPTGEIDFGWDPIFMPDGYDKTFQQMTKEEKNKISMRRQAAQKLRVFRKEN